ncbi:MAG: c-type cytochrome biogenesis protein CcsB [Desulfobacteraceae bacterium]|nr:MAG: c-type cytochrome biogenesis protein CcsB [Desulfobacteraceae bacterium]
MTYLIFKISLWFHLVAAGGFIVFLISRQKVAFRISYWLLLAGFFLHTLFLAMRYVSLGAAPVLDLTSALSFFAWSVTLAYLLLHLKLGLMVLGSFAAPFAAFFMIISSAMNWSDAPAGEGFKSLWLTVHVGTIFLGNGLFAINFLGSIMYLVQEHYIKRKKLGSFYSRLPSLASIDAVNYQSLVVGFPLLTAGMISGSVYAQYALGTYWQWDPKEVWSFLTWLAYAALIHERVAIGWRGRRAAVMSIGCFLLLLFTFIAVSLWMGGYHSFGSLGERRGL